ncbi:hypothetical protein BJV78DRAFT_1284475 [Lactifluus subvellereus]|nr:hypothetical protein BJV78DRAFT_1284475 [Lactifluus subvellereus]
MNSTTDPSSMADPVRDLNNYLQEVQVGTNLTPFLSFTNKQIGPNNQAVHIFTYTFRNIEIGTGRGASISQARRDAATQGLQYLRTASAEFLLDPVRDLNNYLQEIQKPTTLVPFLRFSSVQQGPNHQAVHVGTYTFRDVVIGTGEGISKGIARNAAATQGLQYLHTHGIPSG